MPEINKLTVKNSQGLDVTYDIRDENAESYDYYDEITYKKERYHNTDCYFTTVPLLDNSGKIIETHVRYNDGMTPTEYARENHTTLTTNATLTWKQDNGKYLDTVVIGDGIALNEYTGTRKLDDYLEYVAIKEDRTLRGYKASTTTSAQMISDGVRQAFMSWFRIINNGIAMYPEIDVAIDKHPRQCIGVKKNGDIVFLTCDGRTYRSEGLTASECAEVMLSKGCVNAWNLDGGGSSSTTIKGSKLNSNIDSGGTADRKLNYSLNIEKPIRNIATDKAFSKIGEEKQNIIGSLTNLLSSEIAERISVSGDSLIGKDLNTLTDKVYIGYGNNLINNPAVGNGYFMNIPHDEERFKGLYSCQLFFDREHERIYSRRLINGSFSEWSLANGSAKRFLYYQYPQTINTTGSYIDLLLRDASGNDPMFMTLVNEVESPQHYQHEFSGFTINNSRQFVVKIIAQVTSVNDGNRYIRLGKNGGEVSSTTVRMKCLSGIETIITTEAIVEGFAKSDIFSIQYYGTSGDKIERLKVIIEGSL